MKNISEIKEKIKPSDVATAAASIGISASNGSKALNRPGSKHHEAMLRTLSRIVRLREIIINANA